MAHLLFTADFHQLIKGKLTPGLSCRINYDPLRFSAQYPGIEQEYDQMKIVCHCIYLPGDISVAYPLISEYGIMQRQPVIEMDGTGSMLNCSLNIPTTAREIIIWFTALTRDGKILYDSDLGANFHFRFKEIDIKTLAVSILNGNDGMGWVQGKAITDPLVEAVALRYRLVNAADSAENTIQFMLTENTTDASKTWEIKHFPVPFGAVLAYDYSYYVENGKYKDDNNGNYFIVAAGK